MTRPSSERRQFGRRMSKLEGFVLVPGREARRCVLRNLSEQGALLEFDGPCETPFRFMLEIELHQVRVMCEVRHQGMLSIGVRFVGASVEALGYREAADPGADRAGLAPASQRLAAPGGRAREASSDAPTGRGLRAQIFGVKPAAEQPDVRPIDHARGRTIRGL